MNPEFRTEHDSMGEVQVPRDALYAAQTQRAVDNFQISNLCLPAAFITTLAQIKAACARANAELGLLEKEQADAIVDAADQLISGEHLDQFPVDVFQTGSGTSSNMNMNEVLSALIKQRTGLELHPNDHINMSQSSNDVIPTCIHVSALLQLENSLIPALRHLVGILTRKRSELSQIVKTGRTHLMDAMPIRMDQEVSGWLTQIQDCIARLESVRPRLLQVAQGGTAVGTGVNAPRAFSRLFCRQLSIRTGLTLQPAQNHFTAQACQDTAVELSGQLKTCATALMKIANDLRWMNSGPLAGLGEIALPALQRLFHHARQGQPGDLRSSHDGRRSGVWQRCQHQHLWPARQLSAQYHAAADCLQPVAERDAGRQRCRHTGRQGDRRLYGQQRQYRGGPVAQPGSSHGTQPGSGL